MKTYLPLIIWAVVIGGTFAFLWWMGYLARITIYVRETQDELKKCSWPSWEELKGSTGVVLVTIALLGAFTIGIDGLLSLAIVFLTRVNL